MLDTYTLFGVEFNLLDLIMAILLLGTGIYCIYTSIRVRREYTFFENKVLLPGGCEPNACTDPDEIQHIIDFINDSKLGIIGR